MPSISKDSPQVLIAGAGPTGLVIALCLRQNGVPVRIIAKETEYRIGQRGAGIQPRTVELYHFIGALDDVQKHMVPMPPMRLYELPGGTKPLKTWKVAEDKAPTPDVPWPNGGLMGQTRAEAILREHLAKYGTQVELGTELKTFTQDAEKVTATLTHVKDGKEEIVEVPYLIGADGGRGPVRKQLGLAFLGETHETERFIFGDLRIKAGLDREHWHRWGNIGTVGLMIRPSEVANDTLFNFAIAGANVPYEELASSDDKLIAFIQKETGRGSSLDIESIVWSTDYKPNVRMVDKFSEGRVFVAGDSAHVHSPLGGQGLNSSVQDAFNLAWKLALVTRSLAPPALLASYTAERAPVIAQMLQLSTELLQKTYAGAKDAFNRGGALRQLGVNYRWSDIVVDGEGLRGPAGKAYGDGAPDARLHAGDRAPDAPGLKGVDGRTSLFNIFRPTYHTALVFAPTPGLATPVLDALKKWPEGTVRAFVVLPETEPAAASHDVLVDAEGHAYAAYRGDAKEGETSVVIVRPDAIVGALVQSVDGVEIYRKAIFGA